jgi:hypothetical protein
MSKGELRAEATSYVKHNFTCELEWLAGEQHTWSATRQFVTVELIPSKALGTYDWV